MKRSGLGRVNRHMRISIRGLVLSLMALTVAAACGGAQAPVGSISPTPAAASVFDDHFGFLVGNTVRKEGDANPLFTLQAGKDEGFRVSPDGRRVAFWSGNTLKVLDITASATPRTLITLSAKEDSIHLAWSSDSTGLVVGVSGTAARPGDAPPEYTAIRVIEATGGAARELARVKDANIIPLAWDRQARLIAAYEPFSTGTLYYDTLVEGGSIKRVAPGPNLFFFEGSQNAQNVFGRSLFPPSVVRIWPVASYGAGVAMSPMSAEEFLALAWRPGTAEVGVVFADRLELWSASGARRVLQFPAGAKVSSFRGAFIVFRTDGKAAFISGVLESGTVAIDLTSGVTAMVPVSDQAPDPGLSVRLA